MAGSDCSTSCVNGLRDRPFRCGPGVATRRDKAEPSQVPVLDVQACVSSLTPQSPTTARQKRRRRCCLRPMGKPRHSRLCIFSVLNSSAHLPRCRRFTARLATSRARLAELRGVACSFAVEDLHLLPKHQLAWRTPLDASQRATPTGYRSPSTTTASWTTRACCSPPRSLAGSASANWRTPTSTSVMQPGRANAGDKLLTLTVSALAGGECIDAAAALGAGGTASVLGCTVKAPSTLGARSCAASAGATSASSTASAAHCSPAAGRTERGPGAAPLTIDLDSTICETYGLAKEGARHHGDTGVRGYHPLLAVAAGTGDVLMARLREGRANTARGAAHFLRETVARVRDCRGERAADDARRQRLLQPRRRRRLPRAGCPLLHHHSPAAERTHG